ncbi:MAG: hypothetical protein JXQ96_08330 [Cyclobacteriaceae bacterium]
MKNIYLIFIISVWSSIVSAQDYIDLARFDYSTTPSNPFPASTASTVLREMNGNLTLPIVINDNFALLTGVTYENVSASFDAGRPEEYMTGLALKLGVNIKHNDKWSGTYMLLPQISSDLEKVASRDYQLGGVVLMKYNKTEQFNYKFGIYANSEQFGPFMVPLFGFYRLSENKKFEANVLLPLSLDFNYSVAQDVRFGLNFKGQIKSFNVNTPVGTESERYITKGAKDLYTYFQYGLENGLQIQLGFGRSIGRTYLMYDEKVSFGMPLVYFGDDRTELNSEFEDGWLFKVSAFYRLKL